MKASRRALPLLLLVLLLIFGASMAGAQPKGWPCDYGYRPGNTWFYRSTSFPGEIYKQTVVRDSLGAYGEYWVYLTTDITNEHSWLRIDSTCIFDGFANPAWPSFGRSFIASADSGDWWVVDSADGRPYNKAFIYATFVEGIFGKWARTKEVVYYVGDEPGVDWYGAAEYAEGVGIIRKRSHPSGYDEIIGAIIDGKHYGTTSGVDDEPAVETGRMTLWPRPARDAVTLRFRHDDAHAATVTVHDMLGRPVRRMQLNELFDSITTTPLDVSGFAPGTYMVTVDAGGALQRAPLVVTR